MAINYIINNLKISRMSLCCFITTTFFLCRMGRICLASVSVGEAMAGGRKTTKIGALRVQTKKSAAMYKLRLIFLS